MGQRFKLFPPIPGEKDQWEILDGETGEVLATYRHDAPNAAKEARDYHSRLNKIAKIQKDAPSKTNDRE